MDCIKPTYKKGFEDPIEIQQSAHAFLSRQTKALDDVCWFVGVNSHTITRVYQENGPERLKAMLLSLYRKRGQDRLLNNRRKIEVPNAA